MNFFDEDELRQIVDCSNQINTLVLNSAMNFFYSEFKADEDKATLEKRMAELLFRWLKVSSEIRILADESQKFDEFQNAEWDEAESAETESDDDDG